MIKLLSFRQSGINPPLTLERAEKTRRAYSLELNRHKDVESYHHGSVNTLDIDAAEGRYLLSGASDGVIAIYDLHNTSRNIKTSYKKLCSISKSNRHAHKNSLQTVQWYPLDTGLFTSSGTDKLLKVWDTNALKPAETFELRSIVYSHHLSPVSTQHCLIAVGCQSSCVKLLDLKTGSDTHILKSHRKPVYCVQWSAKDEFLLATGSQDSRVLLWDIRSAKGHLMSLDQHNGEQAGGISQLNTSHNGMVNGMCFTADGLYLLTAGSDDRLRLWNTASGRNTLINYGRVDNSLPKQLGMALSQDCEPDLVFVPCESNIEVLELFTGTPVATLRGHYNDVNCCVFHPESQELYSGANDRNILIWSPDSYDAYDEDVKLTNKIGTTQKNVSHGLGSFTRRTNAMMDAWSSDEDG